MVLIFVLRHGKTNSDNKLDKNIFKKSIPKIIKNIKVFTPIDNVKRIISSYRERCYSSGMMLSQNLDIELIGTEKLNRCDEGKKKSDVRLLDYAEKIKRNVAKHSKKDKDYAIILITHSSVYRTLVKFLAHNKEEATQEWLYFRCLTPIRYNEDDGRFYIEAYNYI